MRLALALLLICVAGQAAAHGTLAGGNSFYAGAAHPFVAFEHLLALLALGLLVGPLNERQIGLAALALTVGVLAGVLAQTQIVASFSTAIFSTVIFSTVIFGIALLFGAVLVLARPMPASGMIAATCVLGGLVGADTDVLGAAGIPLTTRVLATLGLLIGAQVIVLNAAAVARFVQSRGWGVAPRVAGSWIAAIAVLVLTLRLTGAAPAVLP